MGGGTGTDTAEADIGEAEGTRCILIRILCILTLILTHTLIRILTHHTLIRRRLLVYIHPEGGNHCATLIGILTPTNNHHHLTFRLPLFLMFFFSVQFNMSIVAAGCYCSKTSCKTMYCACRKKNMPCTDACACHHFGTCHNPLPANHAATAIPMPPTRCNCRKSKCAKKYCVCFRSGQTCGPACTCDDRECLNHDTPHLHHCSTPPPPSYVLSMSSDDDVACAYDYDSFWSESLFMSTRGAS